MTIAEYGEFAHTYDRLMAEMPYPLWLSFAKTCWRQEQAQPRRIVDLGCGTGTLSLMLARDGYQVQGIDLSADMLTVAADKTERLLRAGSLSAAAAPLWLEQDMREWAVDAQADAVVSFCDCFNYLLEERDIAHTIDRTYSQLASGGVFLFDMLTEHQFRGYARQNPFVYNEEDISYIWTCEYEEESRIIEHDLTIFARENRHISRGMNGSSTHTDSAGSYRKIEELHTQRAYPVDLVVEMLREAGFTRLSCYADFRLKPPGPRAQRVFFSAVKE